MKAYSAYLKVLVKLPFLLTAVCSFSVFADVPKSKQVILYIDLFEKSALNFGNPQINFEVFRKKVNSVFPSRPVRFIAANSIGSLKLQLQTIINSDELISHLIFDGHGRSGSATLTTTEEGKPSVAQNVHTTSIYVGDEFLWINIPMEEGFINQKNIDDINLRTLQVLQPIRGRFTESPVIFWMECDTFNVGNFEKRPELVAIAAAKAAIMSKILGLKSGLIYGNYTKGDGAFYFNFQPFWKQTTWTMRAVHFAIQGGSIGVLIAGIIDNPTYLISLPATVLTQLAATGASRVFRNKGFKFEIKGENVVGAEKIQFKSFRDRVFNYTQALTAVSHQ